MSRYKADYRAKGRVHDMRSGKTKVETSAEGYRPKETDVSSNKVGRETGDIEAQKKKTTPGAEPKQKSKFYSRSEAAAMERDRDKKAAKGPPKEQMGPPEESAAALTDKEEAKKKAASRQNFQNAAAALQEDPVGAAAQTRLKDAHQKGMLATSQYAAKQSTGKAGAYKKYIDNKSA